MKYYGSAIRTNRVDNIKRYNNRMNNIKRCNNCMNKIKAP